MPPLSFRVRFEINFTCGTLHSRLLPPFPFLLRAENFYSRLSGGTREGRDIELAELDWGLLSSYLPGFTIQPQPGEKKNKTKLENQYWYTVCRLMLCNEALNMLSVCEKNLQNEQQNGGKESSSERKHENLRVDSSAGWCSSEEQFSVG